MAEYIEREVVDKVIETARKMYLNDFGAVEVVQQIKSKLCNMPNADVQPIVYAHKTINVGRRSYCSNCGELAIMENFCSKCGAKVEDGEQNG